MKKKKKFIIIHEERSLYVIVYEFFPFFSSFEDHVVYGLLVLLLDVTVEDVPPDVHCVLDFVGQSESLGVIVC